MSAAARAPIAPAVAAGLLADRRIRPADVVLDHKLAGNLVVAVIANGFDSARTPRLVDFPAVRLALAALTPETMP